MIRSALVIILLTLISVGFATVIAILTDKAKPVRWTAAVTVGGILLAGWLFIFWQNSFHPTPPVVIVALGYVAVVATVFNLWRTGAAAVSPNEEDDGDASWGLPIGARGELEREKKSLLKAIKEAEFDLQMRKLSQADADSMIKTFRARAIEVIKEIEKLEGGAAGSVRERIEREVRARIEIEAAVDKKAAAAAAAKQAKKDKKKQRGGDKKGESTEDAKVTKASTAVDAADAKPVEEATASRPVDDASSIAATPETAADVAATDGPAAATTEVATEAAASAAEIASVVETPAAAERAAIAEAAAEAATDANKKAESKTESSKTESSKTESSKTESSKSESSKAESSKSESPTESSNADDKSKKPGAKEAAS